MTRRRKSKKKSTPPKGVPELRGYEVGQYVYALSFPNGVIVRGKISALFKTETDEFAELIDDIGSGYRLALLDDIIDKPTARHINSANSKVASKMRKHAREQEAKREKARKK